MSVQNLYYWRVINGVRTRYRMQLDMQDTCLSDEPDAVFQAPVPTPAARNPVEDFMQREGLTYTLKDGHRILNPPPQRYTLKVMLLNGQRPCKTETCKNLMQQYANAQKKLPEDCPDCEAGQLLRNYLTLLDAVADIELNDNPPSASWPYLPLGPA